MKSIILSALFVLILSSSTSTKTPGQFNYMNTFKSSGVGINPVYEANREYKKPNAQLKKKNFIPRKYRRK